VKLLHHIAVRSDFFSCPGPSPWPIVAGIDIGIFDRPDRSSDSINYVARRISARGDGADDDMAGAGNCPPVMVRSASLPFAAVYRG